MCNSFRGASDVRYMKVRELHFFGYVTLTTHSPPYTKTESTIFTNTLTDRTPTYSSSIEWFSQPRRSHPRPNPWRVYTIHDTAVCFPGTICSKIRHSGRCPPCPIYRLGHCRWIIICYHIFRSQKLFAKSWRSITGRHKRICRKRMRRCG